MNPGQSTCTLPTDCGGDSCSTTCCPAARASDPYCPNCHGADFACLATHNQSGLGQHQAMAGTFNNFKTRGQAGFCKYQEPYPTVALNRSNAYGARLLSSGRVFAGVGLSQAQFLTANASLPDGAVACGMCLEVTGQQATWDCDLTTVPANRNNRSAWPVQSVIVMVIDQCKDNWESYSADGTPAGNCNTGHLDFDVYPASGDIGNLQVERLTWRAVDCPVGDVAADGSRDGRGDGSSDTAAAVGSDLLPVQFAFSTTSSSENYFATHVWDTRSPLTALEVQVSHPDKSTSWQPLTFGSNGWTFQPAAHSGAVVAAWPDAVAFRLTSVHNESYVEDAVAVPVDTWAQRKQWVAWPPAQGKSNFKRAPFPPSADANLNYRHCVTGGAGKPDCPPPPSGPQPHSPPPPPLTPGDAHHSPPTRPPLPAVPPPPPKVHSGGTAAWEEGGAAAGAAALLLLGVSALFAFRRSRRRAARSVQHTAALLD